MRLESIYISHLLPQIFLQSSSAPPASKDVALGCLAPMVLGMLSPSAYSMPLRRHQSSLFLVLAVIVTNITFFLSIVTTAVFVIMITYIYMLTTMFTILLLLLPTFIFTIITIVYYHYCHDSCFFLFLLCVL